MFPADSDLIKRIKSMSNGYHTMMAIITDTHPVFHPQPIELAKERPKQKPGQNIYQYHNAFRNHLLVKAIFLKGSEDLTSKHMIDLFISNCVHADYLLQVSRNDRRNPRCKTWFDPGSLPITLTNYLQASDSPLKRQATPKYGEGRYSHQLSESRYPQQKSGDNKYPYKSYQKKQNALGKSSETTDDDEPDDDRLDQIIHQLASSNSQTPTCILCKDLQNPHRFIDCPYLKDNEFRTTLCIRVASILHRTMSESKRRKEQGPNKKLNALLHLQTKTSQKCLHALLTDLQDASDDEVPSDEDTTTDFPPGDK
jgi:hypothetical protein